MPEHYIRPPLLAREPADPRVAVWRFRLVALIALAVIVAMLALAIRQLSGVNAQDPDVGGGQRAAVEPRLAP